MTTRPSLTTTIKIETDSHGAVLEITHTPPAQHGDLIGDALRAGRPVVIDLGGSDVPSMKVSLHVAIRSAGNGPRRAETWCVSPGQSIGLSRGRSVCETVGYSSSHTTGFSESRTTATGHTYTESLSSSCSSARGSGQPESRGETSALDLERHRLGHPDTLGDEEGEP